MQVVFNLFAEAKQLHSSDLVNHSSCISLHNTEIWETSFHHTVPLNLRGAYQNSRSDEAKWTASFVCAAASSDLWDLSTCDKQDGDTEYSSRNPFVEIFTWRA